MKKRIIALVLALSLAIGLMSGLVFAAEEETSGVCGDNLTWVLEDGVLTIRGTGDMYDYGYHYGYHYGYEENAPWYDLRGEITSVMIESGVANIGSGAFFLCINLVSVSLPSTVTSIGQEAFCGCSSLVAIEIPASVTSIGYGAFGIIIDELAKGNELEVIARSVIFEGYAPELVSSYDSFDGSETYHIFGSVFYQYGGSGTPSYDDYSEQYPDVTIYYYSDAEGFTDEYKAQLEECANVTWVVLERETGSADDNSADTEDTSVDSSSLSIISSETTASYTLGSASGAVIAVDADIETFVSVTVDGAVLTQDVDYTVTEGSTIITFTESFLETLSEGEHEVAIAFEEGNVQTTLKVEAAASDTSSDSSASEDSQAAGTSAETSAEGSSAIDDSSAADVGDSSNLASWMVLGLLAALGLAGAGLKKRITR